MNEQSDGPRPDGWIHSSNSGIQPTNGRRQTTGNPDCRARCLSCRYHAALFPLRLDTPVGRGIQPYNTERGIQPLYL